MEMFNNFEDLFAAYPDKNFGITIGSFDGVHKGHQKLISTLIKKCKEKKLASVVMTFYPHPREIIDNNSDFLMFNESARREFIKQLGVDFIVVFNFNRSFSTLSADDFLNKVLLVSNKIKLIHTGHDFFFGSQKQGNYEYLEKHIIKNNIDLFLSREDIFKNDGEHVSSTEIRNYVKQGNVSEAKKLLGRPYFLEGLIVKGDERGKTLGFPTANFILDKRYILPKNGVYITKSHYKGMVYHSVTNVGTKPTFKLNDSVSVETNIFDFDSDIYGENLRVEFHRQLRAEIKFSSSNELIKQIKIDVESSRQYWVEKK